MPAYGDLVIIVTPKGKRSLRRVDEILARPSEHAASATCRAIDVRVELSSSHLSGITFRNNSELVELLVKRSEVIRVEVLPVVDSGLPRFGSHHLVQGYIVRRR